MNKFILCHLKHSLKLSSQIMNLKNAYIFYVLIWTCQKIDINSQFGQQVHIIINAFGWRLHALFLVFKFFYGKKNSTMIIKANTFFSSYHKSLNICNCTFYINYMLYTGNNMWRGNFTHDIPGMFNYMTQTCCVCVSVTQQYCN